MTRFFLDVMLGKLAVYLRMCGHDAAYALDREVEADDRILGIARDEDRTVLTRDAALFARADDAILLDAAGVEDQLRELRRAGVDLGLSDRPERCGRCNGALEPLAAGAKADGRPGGRQEREMDGETDGEGGGFDMDRPAYAPDDRPLFRCERCGQLFWRGSHWTDVRETLSSL